MQDDGRLLGSLLDEAPQRILVVDDEGVSMFANLAMTRCFYRSSWKEGAL